MDEPADLTTDRLDTARPQWLPDALVTAIVVALPVMVLSIRTTEGEPQLSPGLLVGAALAAPIVLLRRRAPLALLAIATASSVVLLAATHHPSPMLVAVVVVLFTVASMHDRRTSIVAGALTMTVLYVTVALTVDHEWIGPGPLAVVAWTTVAVAAGDAARSRQGLLDAMRDRVVRAEQSRDDEARRRVVEERLRIARELHDVVAHRMAVINVQAGVAAHFLRSEPARAEQAIDVVRTSASMVLDDLSGVLNVLRSNDDEGTPTDPMPTTGDLDALVASFADTGLHVVTEVSGAMPPLSDPAQLAVYRVVQEGLTNARKHGDGTVTLRLDCDPSRVAISVTNRHPSGAAAPGVPGFGLVGMRERVSALGGTLDTTDDGRVFRLAVTIPAGVRR